VLRQRCSQLQNIRPRIKQWSKTHTRPRQGSSQLQKQQAARMSRRLAIEQRMYAAGMADTQGWQFEICWTTQELRMRIKHARKRAFFIVWLFNVQLLGGEKRYGFVWPVMINPPQLLIILTILEMMHMLQAQTCGCISAHLVLPHQKTKREPSDAAKNQLNQPIWNRTVWNLAQKIN